MTSHSKKYTSVAIILHWVIAIAIGFMFYLGWFMEALPKEGTKALSYDLFKYVPTTDSKYIQNKIAK